MNKKTLVKFAAASLIIFLVLSTPAFAETELIYDLKYAEEGRAAGTIVLNIDHSYGQDVTVYYADSELSPLYGYEPLFSFSAPSPYGVSTVAFQMPDTASFPVGATRVVADDGTDAVAFRIPPENRISSEKLYSFGLMSDTHVTGMPEGETEESWTEWDRSQSRSDFLRALAYFNRKETAFNIVAGDITKDGYAYEFEEYAKYLKEADAPFYHVKGNHDIMNDGAEDDNLWLEYVEPNGENYTFRHGEDIYIFISVDNTACDLSEETLVFLENELEKYRDRRVFIIEHAYVGPVGNPDSLDEGDDGLFEGSRFAGILADYPGATLITGHSHFEFEMQGYEETANCAWATDEMCHRIHVPSLSKPAYYNEEDEEVYRKAEGSQAYIVDVYEDYVLFRGLDFEGCEIGQVRYLPYAQYMIPFTKADPE